MLHGVCKLMTSTVYCFCFVFFLLNKLTVNNVQGSLLMHHFRERHIYGAPEKLLQVRGHLTGYIIKCFGFTDVCHKYKCWGVCFYNKNTHSVIFNTSLQDSIILSVIKCNCCIKSLLLTVLTTVKSKWFSFRVDMLGSNYRGRANPRNILEDMW